MRRKNGAGATLAVAQEGGRKASPYGNAQEGGRKARPYGIACVLLALVLLAGCAGKRDLDPNYVQYLAALDAHAQNAATQDRTLVRMVAHDGRPIQIDAASYEVRLPPAPLPVPEQFRDFTAEMTVQAWRDGVVSLGGPLVQGLFGYLGKVEDRKTYGEIMRYAGGASFTATEASQINFSGGWGDRSWGYQGGGFSEALTPDVVEVRPEVVVVPAGGGE